VSESKQVTEAELKTMSADEIVAAQEAGRLDHLLGVKREG
jgi:hypothetical protein